MNREMVKIFLIPELKYTWKFNRKKLIGHQGLNSGGKSKLLQ